jgi:hypothetical protein
MHRGPNASALRTPVQFFAGCGSLQRKSPTGGSAKGIPLKLRTPEFSRVVASRKPLATLTRSAPNASPGKVAPRQIAMAKKLLRFGDFILSCPSSILSPAACVRAPESDCPPPAGSSRRGVGRWVLRRGLAPEVIRRAARARGPAHAECGSLLWGTKGRCMSSTASCIASDKTFNPSLYSEAEEA